MDVGALVHLTDSNAAAAASAESAAASAASQLEAAPQAGPTETATENFPAAAAAIFAGGASASSDVTVSLNVTQNPADITVTYRDSATGQVLTNVPPLLMVQLADFFDRHAGSLVDRSV